MRLYTLLSVAGYDICLLCMFIGIDYLPLVAIDIIILKTSPSSAKPSRLVLQVVGSFAFIVLNKIEFMWNRKITACSSMMTSVCITSDYCITTHSDARFDPNIIHVNML